MKDFGESFTKRVPIGVLAFEAVFGLVMLLGSVLSFIYVGPYAQDGSFSWFVAFFDTFMICFGLWILSGFYRDIHLRLIIDKYGIYEEGIKRKIGWEEIKLCRIERGNVHNRGVTNLELVIYTENERIRIDNLQTYYPSALNIFYFIKVFDGKELAAVIRYYSGRDVI